MALIQWPAFAACVGCLLVSTIQTPPIPKPFPKPGESTTAPAKPVEPPPPPAQPKQEQGPRVAQATPSPGIPTAESLGAPLYPTAEFLESFDAGRGQRYYIFGTNAAYSEIVAYYKNTMRNGGRTVFEAPAMQQWDLGKFQDQTMNYQPSVVVKDYTWNAGPGYLFVNGTQEKRFKTVIQIVPAPAAPIK